MTLQALLQKITDNQQSGYLTDGDLTDLAKLDRLRKVLVRCGCGRFICAVQDAKHFRAIIERDYEAMIELCSSGGSTNKTEPCDYIRDISLPVGDDAFRGVWRAHTFEGGYHPDPPKRKPNKRGPFPDHCYDRDTSADYGGVFDGFSVTSDADPGL